ncbi:MAG TPA: hypothetical protein VF838_17570 [Trebonia sp.]
MQDRLGVAVGLGRALEDEVGRGGEGDARREVGSHRPVGGVTLVLLVDHGGEPLEALRHLLSGDDAVAEPVGEQLAGDAQRGPVLHQGDVVDVRHLRAADPLVDPADHVAEDGLHVEVDLVLPGFRRQGGRVGQRDLEHLVPVRGRPLGEFGLPLRDVDLVVVQCVQRRGGGRGHPRGARARARVGDLLRQHVRHQVGHGPHALADLGTPGQAVRQPDVHVAVLVGEDPRRRLHGGLARHGPGCHRGVDLVAGAVEEAGVDEHDPVPGRVHGGGEVQRGAPLLVHQPDLERVRREPEQFLYPAEEGDGEGHLLRPVLLGLDDVDRPGPAVAVGRAGPEAGQRGERGDDGVQDALEDLRPVGVEDRVGGHQVADVPDEQQRPAGQGERPALRVGVGAVRLEHPGEGPAALLHRRAQLAGAEAEPVAVRGDLVRGVYRRDRVLEVDDRGDGGLGEHVLDPGRVALADGAGAVDDELDVQAVMAQQDALRGLRVAGVAGERVLAGERDLAVLGAGDEPVAGDGVGGHVAVRRAVERHRLVEEVAHGVDHPLAANRVVASFPGRPVGFWQRVGAVERVVQRAPARVGRVDREPGVGHRDHQLRARHGGDLGIDALGADLERPRVRDQVAGLLKERPVRGHVVRPAGVRPVPVVNRRLELVAPGEQAAVDRREVGDDLRRARPERVCGEADVGGGQRLLGDEAGQAGRDL